MIFADLPKYVGGGLVKENTPGQSTEEKCVEHHQSANLSHQQNAKVGRGEDLSVAPRARSTGEPLRWHINGSSG